MQTLQPKNLEAIYQLAAKSFDPDFWFGVCLGKYDFVIEFKEENAMIASYKVKKLQSEIQKTVGIHCSASLYLCKQIHSEGTDGRPSSLRSYVFVRPADLDYPMSELLKGLNSSCGKVTRGRLMWNTTSYSAIVTLEGENVQDLITGVLTFRKSVEGRISDTSTIVSIAFDSNGIASDKSIDKNVPCIIHVKMKKYDEGEWSGSRLGKAEVTLGWFDLTFEESFQSVNSLVSSILELRQASADRILETATVILRRRT